MIRKSYLKLMLLLSCFTGSVQSQVWTENDKLVSNNRQIDGYFSSDGEGVSLSGDFAVVGAPREDFNNFSEAGRAYIYEKDGNCNWILHQVINPPFPGAGDHFGFSVSVDQDILVIASLNDDEDANETNTVNNAGAVFIYRNISGTWTFVQKIVAADREVDAFFGHSVDVSFGRIIVGAWGDNQGPATTYEVNAGAAYIFDFNGTDWVETQRLSALDRSSQDAFGESVSIFGNFAIVGASREDEDANGNNTLPESGSAYMFELNNNTWNQVQKLTSSDRGGNERFGNQVAISGFHAIVSCQSDQEDAGGANPLSAAGSAFIFNRNNVGVWVLEQKVDASDRSSGDRFGSSVAIEKQYAVVGAVFEDNDENGSSFKSGAGSAYIYQLDGTSWNQVQKIVSNDRAKGDRFGSSIAVWDDQIIVGAVFEDEDDGVLPSNTLSSAGSAYLFEINVPAIAPNVSASTITICSGENTTLFASGALGDAAHWQWYADSCNGTAIGTGSSITVSPTVTTTYYVNGVGGCSDSGPCDSITIQVNTSFWHQTTKNANGGDVNNDIAIDEENNVYVAGTFTETTTLDGGGNADHIFNTAADQTASYVAKYDQCGNLLWSAHSSNGRRTLAHSVVLNEIDELVYVAGEFYGNIEFQTSSGCLSTTLYGSGETRSYIAAFDINTGCAVSVDEVSANYVTVISSIAINESTGALYVGGNGSSNFSGFPHTSYVFKYLPTSTGIGNVIASITANNFGANNTVNDLDFDEQNNALWVIGDFEQKVEFSPGNGVLTTLPGTVQDAYLLAYKDLGNSFSTLVNHLGNAAFFMSGQGIAVDPTTGVPFMTGTFRGPVNDPFDFGVLNSLPTLNGYSAYCASYDFAGAGWIQYYNSLNGNAEGVSVAHDGIHSYFTGTFNNADLNVQTLGIYPYSIIGSTLATNHTVVACYDNNGQGLWANVTVDPVSNSAIHDAKSIAVNDEDHIFITGSYREEMDYLNTTGAIALASTGNGANGFILRAEKTNGNLFKTSFRVEEQAVIAGIEPQFTVYPNPTSSTLTLEFTSFDTQKTYEGLLMNSMGQLVFSQIVTNSNTDWDLSDLSSGIYLLVITDGIESQTIRISKTN